MAEHTPGPWRYSVSYGGYKFDNNEPNGEYIITGSCPRGSHVLPILGRTHNWPQNAEANARLIAAAPEMLEALEALVSSAECGAPDTDPIHPRLWRQAKAAIAAAKGVE